MEFDQTFITNLLWGKDECVGFWSQKVKSQGHNGVIYAPKCIFWLCQHDISTVSFLSHVGRGIIVFGVIETI